MKNSRVNSQPPPFSKMPRSQTSDSPVNSLQWFHYNKCLNFLTFKIYRWKVPTLLASPLVFRKCRARPLLHAERTNIRTYYWVQKQTVPSEVPQITVYSGSERPLNWKWWVVSMTTAQRLETGESLRCPRIRSPLACQYVEAGIRAPDNPDESFGKLRIIDSVLSETTSSLWFVCQWKIVPTGTYIGRFYFNERINKILFFNWLIFRKCFL